MKCFRHLLFCMMASTLVIGLVSCGSNGKDRGVNPNNPNNHNQQDDPNNSSCQSVGEGKVILRYDSSNLIVYENGDTPVLIPDGKAMKVGTQIICDFYKSAIEKNKVFDGFLYNGKKIFGAGESGESYIVSGRDSVVEGGKSIIRITISQRNKSSEKVKLVFGENIRAEQKINDSERLPVSTGTMVEDGEVMVFTACLSEGKMFDKWLVNEKPHDISNSTDMNSLTYIVNVQYSKIVGTEKLLEVKFSEKDARQITLQFDTEVIEKIFTEGEDGKRQIEQNEEVLIGTSLLIEVKDKKSESKVVDYWTLNGKKTQAIKSSVGKICYVVDAKDAINEGGKSVIKIGAVFRAGM